MEPTEGRLNMEKTALVLAGGGSRGSYELGVWQALREMDIDIDIVTGTSIGAINGALIAQGDYDTAVELWNKIETSHVFEVEMDEQLSLKQKVAQAYKTFLSKAAAPTPIPCGKPSRPISTNKKSVPPPLSTVW